MISSLKNWFIGLATTILAITPQTVSYTQQHADEVESYKTGLHSAVNLDIENTYIKKTVRTPSIPKSTAIGTSWWSYPENIKPTTRDGNDLLVLVNKEYQLPSGYIPSDLVSASLSGIRRGEKYQLRNILIEDLRNLVNDAKASGIDLSIVSGYRSYQQQVTTYKYWVGYNGGVVDYADRISARAGHSQHQLGTAIDFSSAEINDGLSGLFGNTQASKWLYDNAWKYGFVISFPKGAESITGYSYESWHYRYIGKANAQEMINSGMILENYLKSKN
ncbi:MAG: M15 family metallopeptidase [Candidatus Dojkabacteria bacterium]|jgi:D-alanyl-D-alanine carboxypeptidase